MCTLSCVRTISPGKQWKGRRKAIRRTEESIDIGYCEVSIACDVDAAGREREEEKTDDMPSEEAGRQD